MIFEIQSSVECMEGGYLDFLRYRLVRMNRRAAESNKREKGVPKTVKESQRAG